MSREAEGGEAQGTAAEHARAVKAFWDGRAELGFEAGTNDRIGKQLEVEAICSHVADGMRILDAGCGNGVTALEIARRHEVELTAFDFSEPMIEGARAAAAEASLRGSVAFAVGNVCALAAKGPFDLAYTERVLINLPDWQTQRRAIEGIRDVLAPGGVYVMCENSIDGLERINAMRAGLGLSAIEPPWHNRYLRDAELSAARIDGLVLERVEHFSSTYFFLSRVVNAWMAAQEHAEPSYDAPINRLALSLPALGDAGQTCIWLWRREDV